MKKAHVFVSGFVQGVGFRHFVRKKALELGLTGWVKNLPDNRVEALFQGDEKKINEVIEICRKGPFLSEIEDVIVNWVEDQEMYEEFRIIQD